MNTYNNQRQRASTMDARGKTTNHTTHSPTGKLLVATLPGGATITDVYDSRDWKESTTNPKLATETVQTTSFVYAPSGEMLQQFDPLNRLTYFDYDFDSRQTLVGDALNHEVETGYNGRGLVTSNTDQLEKGSSNDYDDAGRRFKFTNRRTQPYIFTHDNADRPLSTKTPNLRISSQTWTARGLVDTMTEPSLQGTTLDHDARGRLQMRSDGVGSVTYTYDGNDNLRTVVQGGVTIERTYDALNRVQTYSDGRGHTVGYGYDNNGNPTTLTYEPGKAVTYVYDDRNRLTEIHDWTGRATYLTYDGPGRLLTTTRPNNTVRTHTWDAAGQLKSVVDKHTPSGKPVLALKLDYDLAGRLKDKFEVPAWGSLPALPARNAAYNNDNQLATLNGQTIVYDLDGNTTSAPAPTGVSPLESYGWNTRNQLTSAPGGLAYSYDAEGLRTSYTENAGTLTTFVNDPHRHLSRVLWRVRPDGTRTFYIYGPVLLYEIEESASGSNPANAARFYHYDHLGSTIALSNDAGQPVARANYSAYGVTINTSGTLDTPFQWQGAFGVQTDPNGLHNMRARYYHAYLGRFLSEDPLGFAGGSNFYAYCNGDPISRVDPSGSLDNTTAVQLGLEWLSGTGPRHHDFTDGDPFAEQLRQHNNLQAGFQNAAQQAAAAAARGQTSVNGTRHNYDLSGIEGVPKYLNDYSTVVTGGATGNLAVTYLGSYRTTMNVTNINAAAGTANVQAVITNSSTIASGTRPPVLGYTEFWQTNIAPRVNSFFSSGPMSPTTQSITLNQQVNFAPAQPTPFRGSGFGGLFNSGGSSNK